jgi:hypothetical protein
MLRPLATSKNGQATQRLGAISPSAQAGALMSHAIAGRRAYQRRSLRPRRSASQPPAKTPAVPPIRSKVPIYWPVEIRSTSKLRMITDGVHSARP